MCILAMNHDMTYVSDNEHSKLMSRAHEVAFISSALEDLIDTSMKKYH